MTASGRMSRGFLRSHYEFDEGVEVADLGTPALDLIDQLSANDAVILIDSVDVNATDVHNDETKLEPGTVLLYRKEDIMLQCPTVRMDPHSPALVDALLSAELFGVAPRDVLLVGVQAQTFDADCGLTAPVKESLEQVVAEVLNELDRLGVGYWHRVKPTDMDIWWETEQKSAALLTH